MHFFFLMVPTVDLALSKSQRPSLVAGGHNIPEPIVRRRFDRSIENFFALLS